MIKRQILDNCKSFKIKINYLDNKHQLKYNKYEEKKETVLACLFLLTYFIKNVENYDLFQKRNAENYYPIRHRNKILFRPH